MVTSQATRSSQETTHTAGHSARSIASSSRSMAQGRVSLVGRRQGLICGRKQRFRLGRTAVQDLLQFIGSLELLWKTVQINWRTTLLLAVFLSRTIRLLGEENKQMPQTGIGSWARGGRPAKTPGRISPRWLILALSLVFALSAVFHVTSNHAAYALGHSTELAATLDADDQPCIPDRHAHVPCKICAFAGGCSLCAPVASFPMHIHVAATLKRPALRPASVANEIVPPHRPPKLFVNA